MIPTSPSKLYPKNIDLTNCDKEPIHFIGKIQNHGFLLCCDRKNYVLTRYSANGDSFLNLSVRDYLGSSIYKLIDKAIIEDLFLQLKDKTIAYKETELNSKFFTIIVHQSAQEYVLEFELNSQEINFSTDQHLLTQMVSEINNVKNIEAHYKRVATLIKDYLGYDRVMIYRFDAQWNGSVVAEKKEAHLESWLGLQYPMSDIPQQARQLFLKQGVRIIANVNANPVNILSTSSEIEDVDLSRSELRSVSPIHIQYLINMKVSATLTVAIVSNGILWGLIACHHYSPKYIGYNQRLGCKFLSQVLATKIHLNHTNTIFESQQKSRLISRELINQINGKEDVVKGLSQFTHTINDLVSSSGAAIFIENKIVTMGSCPNESDIFKLIQFIRNQTQEELYYTHHISGVFEPAKRYRKIASGVLCLFLYKHKNDALIWFKPEVIETINWAGNPNKKEREAQNGLSPRKSFEKWTERQQGKAVFWNDHEISTCINLKKNVFDIIIEKYEGVNQLNKKLKMAYDELESFSYSVSHDLRAPLRGIEGFAHIIKEDYFELLDSFGKSSIETIVSSVEKMNSLIDGILLYSGLGRKPIEDRTFSIKKEIELIVSDLKMIYPLVSIKIENELPDINGDRRIIVLLLKNLIENAMKYSSKVKKPEVLIGCKERNIFFIKDNGIGFDMRYKHQIFGVFNRLVNHEYPGSGIGLAIVKRVIDKHNGKIWVESKKNKGSAFYFSFKN